ncbi:MAG: CrcB family protein [Rhodoglobus sp.]
MTALVVAATLGAGAVGALLRYLVARAFATRGPFPWAVLVVNVVGSAIGGVVVGLAERGDVAADIRFIIVSGLCAGLTTFSTWSVETVQLVLAGRARVAIVSVAANLVLGIGAALVGYLLVSA